MGFAGSGRGGTGPVGRWPHHLPRTDPQPWPVGTGLQASLSPAMTRELRAPTGLCWAVFRVRWGSQRGAQLAGAAVHCSLRWELVPATGVPSADCRCSSSGPPECSGTQPPPQPAAFLVQVGEARYLLFTPHGVSDPGFWLTGEGVPLSPAKLNGSDSSKSLPSPSSSPQPDWIASPTHDPQWCPSDPTDSSLSSLFGESLAQSSLMRGLRGGPTGAWGAVSSRWQNAHWGPVCSGVHFSHITHIGKMPGWPIATLCQVRTPMEPTPS